MGANDAHPLTEEQLDALVDELQDRLGDSTAQKYGRRGVLAALGVAALGTGSASGQASGAVGTASNPVDVEGYDVSAQNSFTDPAGVSHSGELADASDVGSGTGQWQEVNSGSNIEPIDGETIGTGSEDVDVGTVSTTASESESTPYVNVKAYGAAGDGTTNDTAAIDAAINELTSGSMESARLYFPAGTYLYSGSLSGFGGTDKAALVGDGQAVSQIEFTDSTVSYCVNPADGQSINSFRMENIGIIGPGQAAGTDVHGIAHSNANFVFNLEYHSIQVKQVSGNAWDLTGGDTPFSWSMINCTPKQVGSHGVFGPAGNTCYIRGFGRYATDIDGWLMWLTDGTPTIETVNGADLGTSGVDQSGGLKFGSASSDPLGLSFCHPRISNVNLEPVTGDYGIKFEIQSEPTLLDNITIYAPDGGTLPNGIYYASLDAQVRHRRVVYDSQGTGSYGAKLTVNSGTGGILSDSPQPSNLGSSTTGDYYAQIGAKRLGFLGTGVKTNKDFIATDSQGNGLLVEDASNSGDIYRVRVDGGTVVAQGPL